MMRMKLEREVGLLVEGARAVGKGHSRSLVDRGLTTLIVFQDLLNLQGVTPTRYLVP